MKNKKVDRQKRTDSVRKWSQKTQGLKRGWRRWTEYETKLVALNDKLTSFELAHILQRSAHSISCKRTILKKRGEKISNLFFNSNIEKYNASK